MREIRKDKEDWFTKQCQSIEINLRKGNSREVYQTVKLLTNKHQTRIGLINDKNGNTRSEAREVAGRWKEYCQELYNHKYDTNDRLLQDLDNNQEQEEDPVITRDEVVAAVRQLKRGKATGIDNVLGELIKDGGESMIDSLNDDRLIAKNLQCHLENRQLCLF